jgi:hypothetical protein
VNQSIAVRANPWLFLDLREPSGGVVSSETFHADRDRKHSERSADEKHPVFGSRRWSIGPARELHDVFCSGLHSTHKKKKQVSRLHHVVLRVDLRVNFTTRVITSSGKSFSLQHASFGAMQLKWSRGPMG